VIDTRKQNTSLLLKDGQVVIMGGLRRREKTTQVTKIPLLGDLPLLGNLFRSQQDYVLNSELVVLLSPHIYRDEAVPDSVLKKYRELKENAALTGAVSKQ
jgi:type II secretory pathway component GspD/PulD (secretin)